MYSEKWNDSVGQKYYQKLQDLVDSMNTQVNEICNSPHLIVNQISDDKNTIEKIIRICKNGGRFF